MEVLLTKTINTRADQIHPYDYENSKGVKSVGLLHSKQKQYVTVLSVPLTEKQRRIYAQMGIRPEHIRRFIDDYAEKKVLKIKSDQWRELSAYIDASYSLQLVGDLGSGKTYLTKLLIENDKDHIYIVLDAHAKDNYNLPETNTILPDFKESMRIRLPDQPAGAVGLFPVYYNLITNNQFPKHYVFVVEEALRYEKAGIVNLMAEARKFLKVLAISQQRIVDFCPAVYVQPFQMGGI